MEMLLLSKLTHSIWTTRSRRLSLRDARLEVDMGRLQGHEADSETKTNIARSSQTATRIAPQAEFEERVNRFFRSKPDSLSQVDESEKLRHGFDAASDPCFYFLTIRFDDGTAAAKRQA